MSKSYKWIIDKSFDFCFGHRVWSQALDTKYSLDGCLACRHLHGHQGKVKLFLGANELHKGMVTDFKHTNIFKKWLDDIMDHKFIIDRNDPLFPVECSELYLNDANDPLFPHECSELLQEGVNWINSESIIRNDKYKYWTPNMEYIESLGSSMVQDMKYSPEMVQAIMEKYEGLIIVDFIPTSENLCKWWYEVANKMLNGLGIDVVAVEYWETPKSHCRYDGSL